jgi:hypothetical protein
MTILMISYSAVIPALRMGDRLMNDQDHADPEVEVSPYFQLNAFEARYACLTAALVEELADPRDSRVNQTTLVRRWVERWPTLTRGIDNTWVAGRLDRGLRWLEAAGAVHLDEHSGIVTIADPVLLAMSAENRLIVTRPDGGQIKPRKWTRLPTVPEHLTSVQQQHHERLLDGIAREPGPLTGEDGPGYGFALRSHAELTGTVAACDASVHHSSFRQPQSSRGFHLGMAFVNNNGGWWVAREFLRRSRRYYDEAVDLAELVAAAAAIIHHHRAVRIVTDSSHVRSIINRWREGYALAGPNQPRILTLASHFCAEHPQQFTVEQIPRNTTAPHQVAHDLSRLLSGNHNIQMQTINDIKARTVELAQNLHSATGDTRGSPKT